MNTQDCPKQSYTVAELTDLRTDEVEWKQTLAFLQRGEVWPQDRDAYLLDSLLRGYPVGSLLFCRIQPTRTADIPAVESPNYQLVDGQQRIGALHRLFRDAEAVQDTEEEPTEKSAPLLLKLTHEFETVTTGASADNRRRATEYIQPEGQVKGERGHYLDLSKWRRWAQEKPDDAARLRTPDDLDVTACVRRIDCNVNLEDLDEAGRSRAEKTLRSLARVWTGQPIPAVSASVQSPAEMLDLFTRLNTAGVRVSGPDLYYAGIKTYWRGAPDGLDRVTGSSHGLLRRFDALTLIGRLAALCVGNADPVSLSLEALTRNLEPMIEVMEQLSEEGGEFLSRLNSACCHLRQTSKLSAGLSSVSTRDLLPVIAWMVLSEASGTNSPIDLDTYLVGVTLYRYRSILKEKYFRIAMNEAILAGLDNRAFPSERIINRIRAEMNFSANGRRVETWSPNLKVPNMNPDAVYNNMGNPNKWFILSVLQEMESCTDADLDHIFPRAERRKLKVKRGGGKKIFHQGNDYTENLGNFWWLPKSTNRHFGSTLPHQKLSDMLSPSKHPSSSESHLRIYPRSQWAMSDEEIDGFWNSSDSIEQCSNDGDAVNIEGAIDRLVNTIKGRRNRLVNQMFDEQHFPGAANFAATERSEDVETTDRINTTDLQERLGVHAA